MEPQSYYKPAEAARFARVGVTTIRDAYRSGALRVLHPTRHPVIKHEDLVAWIESPARGHAAEARTA